MKVKGTVKWIDGSGKKFKSSGKVKLDDISAAQEITIEGDVEFQSMTADEIKIKGSSEFDNVTAKKIRISGKAKTGIINTEQLDFSGKLSSKKVKADYFKSDGRIIVDHVESKEVNIRYVHDDNHIGEVSGGVVRIMPAEDMPEISLSGILSGLVSHGIDVKKAHGKIKIDCLRCERAVLRGDCFVEKLICPSVDADDSVKIMNREGGM